VKKYETRNAVLRADALAQVGDVFQPAEPERLAAAVKEIVCKKSRLLAADVHRRGRIRE
jgi:hypothetical protein